MVIKGCSIAPPTTEIDARTLPLCETSTIWMLCSWGNPLCFCPNPCAYVCLNPLYFCPVLCAYVLLYASVYVCERVFVISKTAVLVHETGAVDSPIPKAEYLPFVIIH